MRWTAAAILLAAATLAEPAPLRCGQDLVQVGDSALDVLDACGEPSRRLSVLARHRAELGTAWVYEGGYGQADRRVIFSAGRVERIERLD